MTEQRPGVDDAEETGRPAAGAPTPDQAAAQVAEDADTASPTSAQADRDVAPSD